ncbi:MAG: tRNA 4-thiouridine(8) synthase ThiI, partial [Patescibacteria group bacterium]|nr:tRNA 4-thiouridine(8) synthase ThiI [Patescibacteria group bacterium]
AEKNNIKLITRNISEIHWDITKSPHFGHGKNLNPCIDCHALMFREAWRIKNEIGIDILATGEVLGQRPFSQNKQAFGKIEKHIEMEGRILRPLSGKILPKTIYEDELSVDREQLEDIQGRSRKKQLQLAKNFGVDYFPTPAGGCCLTEKDFSEKLQKLMNFCENPLESDFSLLKLGRHFWEDVESKMVHFVVGRNKEENEKITSLREKSDLIVEKDDGKGPTVLIRGFNDKSKDLVIEKAQEIIWEYSKNDFENWRELRVVVKKEIEVDY